MPTKIEWCDETINPMVGCSKCSPGCDNCYAEKMAFRLSRMPHTAEKYAGVVDEAGRWTGNISSLDLSVFDKLPNKPRSVFLGSMTDIFHKNITDEDIISLFDKIWEYHLHTFLLLTKRPERMAGFVKNFAYRKCFGWIEEQINPFSYGEWIHIDDLYMRNMCGWVHKFTDEELDEGREACCDHPKNELFGLDNSCQNYLCPMGCHLDKDHDEYQEMVKNCCEDEGWIKILERPKSAMVKNIWLGVTVCNQYEADEKIPILQQIPTTQKFISIEPMLGPIDISKACLSHIMPPKCVIVGGETGPYARPMRPDWVRSIRDQCAAAGVPFFFKGWGKYKPCREMTENCKIMKFCRFLAIDGSGRYRPPKKCRLLDGVEHNERPW